MRFIGLPKEYESVIGILGERLSLDSLSATVTFCESDKMIASREGGDGVISCRGRAQFARLLGIFVENYPKGDFRVEEKPSFDTVSCMLDLSFFSPMKVESIKEYIEYMALYGFNQIQLYMEDLYELEGRPYFGYMRGRYTAAQLREIDDYADDLGIEAVPCIQTLGHMSNYLKWNEAASVKDTSGVLLVDNEPTYEFIEQMLLAASAPFRTKKIHVGCDETYGLGTGKYLKTHEKADTMDLYLAHVSHVAALCEKHGLSPMMWSDMLCSSFSGGGGNFSTNINIPDYVKDRLPENMKLVFWHYGQRERAEGDIIPKHRALGKDPIFAGASHLWQSVLPDSRFSILANASSINECKRLGTREIMMTVWCYFYSVYQTSLLDLCLYGELAYRDTYDELCERFEFVTGASYEAFIRMSDFAYMYKTDEERDAYVFGRGETGHVYFMTDLLLNVKEGDWLAAPRVEFYASAAEYFKKISAIDGKWQFLYRLSYALFDMMRAKSLVVENLLPAYKSGDRAKLSEIVDRHIPEYISALECLSDEHGYQRDEYLRPFGTEKLDAAYGKMKERARTVRRRIKAYLDGKIETIEELEEKKLAYQWGIIP